MNSKIQLDILNLRARHKAWSRQRMLLRIFVAAMMACAANPVRAQGLEQHQLERAATEATVVAETKANTHAVDAVDAAPVALAAPAPLTSASSQTPADTHAQAEAQAKQKTTPKAQSNEAAESLNTFVSFDFNEDGKTDDLDWTAYTNWAKNYTTGEFNSYVGRFLTTENGGLSLAGAAAIIANSDAMAKTPSQSQTTQDAQSHQELQIRAKAAARRRYFLPNRGESTSVKNQGPMGTCWAFSNAAVLESAILKERARLQKKTQTRVNTNAQTNAEHDPIDTAPLLENELPKLDLSELAIALNAYTPQSPAQGAEGAKDVLPGHSTEGDALNIGGYFSCGEVLFTNWKGIALEKDEPYMPQKLNIRTLQDYVKAMFEEGERFNSPKNWSLFRNTSPLANSAQGKNADAAPQKPDARLTPHDASHETPHDTSTNASSRAIAHVNGVYYLPAVNTFRMDKKGSYLFAAHNAENNLFIKEALMKYGAVEVGINADRAMADDATTGNYYNLRESAQYNSSIPTMMNHAVTIVGWDDDFKAEKFKAAKNDVSTLKNGAWLVKNSWGSYYDFEELCRRFGVTKEEGTEQVKSYIAQKYKSYNLSKEDIDYYANWYLNQFKSQSYGIKDASGQKDLGYFWLSYYDHSITGPCAMSVDIPDDGFDYDNNYAYDFSISTANTPFVLRTQDPNTRVANIFSAKGNEVLRAVSARTSTADSVVTTSIYLIDEGQKDLRSALEKAPLFSQQDHVEFAGFSTITLKRPVALSKGQRFACVQSVQSINPKNGKQESWLNLETGIAQALQQGTPRDEDSKGRVTRYLLSTIVAHENESFARVRTQKGYSWKSPQEIGKLIAKGSAFEFGNAHIKAFTTNGALTQKDQETIAAYESVRADESNERAGLPISDSEEASQTVQQVLVAAPSSQVTEDASAAAHASATTLASATETKTTKAAYTQAQSATPSRTLSSQELRTQEAVPAPVQKAVSAPAPEAAQKTVPEATQEKSANASALAQTTRTTPLEPTEKLVREDVQTPLFYGVAAAAGAFAIAAAGFAFSAGAAAAGAAAAGAASAGAASAGAAGAKLTSLSAWLKSFVLHQK